jgi:tRNA modification GTPase
MTFGELNAGKSSLFTFLLREGRAIVSEIAGTTRDIISERMMIGNNILKICDMVGLRDGALGKIEKTGIGKAITRASNADFFRIVVNINSSTLPVVPNKMVNCFNDANALVVVNKINLLKNCSIKDFLPHFLTSWFPFFHMAGCMF